MDKKEKIDQVAEEGIQLVKSNKGRWLILGLVVAGIIVGAILFGILPRC